MRTPSGLERLGFLQVPHRHLGITTVGAQHAANGQRVRRIWILCKRPVNYGNTLFQITARKSNDVSGDTKRLRVCLSKLDSGFRKADVIKKFIFGWFGPLVCRNKP